MDAEKLLMIIFGTTTSIAVLFMIVFGAVTSNPGLVNPGWGAVTMIIGALLGYYFNYKHTQARIKELERRIEKN